ncbi:hypothetical protein D3C72_1769690 [compost metagenome]
MLLPVVSTWFATILYLPGSMRLPLASLPSQVNAVSPAALASTLIEVTLAPLASVTSTVTMPAAGAATVPSTEPSFSSTSFSDGTSTWWPTSAAPRSTWSLAIDSWKPFTDLFRSVMPCTVDICAICETICVLSIGFSGSWCCSCSVIRRRKSAWSSVFFFLVALLLGAFRPRAV